MRRRMRTTDETIRHGYEAGDRVRTPVGPGTVWLADMRSSWVVTVELDESTAPGQWWGDFPPHKLERIWPWEENAIDIHGLVITAGDRVRYAWPSEGSGLRTGATGYAKSARPGHVWFWLDEPLATGPRDGAYRDVHPGSLERIA